MSNTYEISQTPLFQKPSFAANASLNDAPIAGIASLIRVVVGVGVGSIVANAHSNFRIDEIEKVLYLPSVVRNCV